MKRAHIRISNIIFFLLLWVSCSVTQTLPKTDDEVKAIFKKDISTLAADKFMGRGTGTEGEKLASDYIVSYFKKLKLIPKGTDGFLQPFAFTAATKTGTTSTQFYINSKSYRLSEDFYPLSFSGNGIASGYIVKVGSGIVEPNLKHDDYAGKLSLSKKIFVIETGTPDGNNPHGEYAAWYDLRKKTETAITKGAAAVIFINSDTTLENPAEKISTRIFPVKIPVIFAKGDAVKILKNDIVTNCTVGVDIIREEKTGHNVIALLDNKAATTIVIGAHYDHLGMGEESGSLYRGPAAVHNGADDNASGTAMLMQLALHLKQPKFSKSNYLLIAFSGEERGLLGSSHFVKNPTIDLKTVSCMINMDMVGRLKTDEKTLIINGAGTSPRWKTVLDSVAVDGVKIKTSESGVGPSDHTSFYLQDIPALHFFSGTHEDYHKPGDDEDKINYDGMVSIQKMMLNLIERIQGSGKLVFTKTKDSSSEDAPRMKVTLGIIPDYAYSGEGVRADGITEGRPAANAGMKKGDIILQLGTYKTSDMMEYMKALSKFSKEQSTTVKVKRGTEMLELKLTF